MFASRNSLLTVILVLTAVLTGVGYALYAENKKPDGVEIKIGEGGISIEEN